MFVRQTVDKSDQLVRQHLPPRHRPLPLGAEDHVILQHRSRRQTFETQAGPQVIHDASVPSRVVVVHEEAAEAAEQLEEAGRTTQLLFHRLRQLADPQLAQEAALVAALGAQRPA